MVEGLPRPRTVRSSNGSLVHLVPYRGLDGDIYLGIQCRSRGLFADARIGPGLTKKQFDKVVRSYQAPKKKGYIERE